MAVRMVRSCVLLAPSQSFHTHVFAIRPDRNCSLRIPSIASQWLHSGKGKATRLDRGGGTYCLTYRDAGFECRQPIANACASMLNQ